MEQFKIYFLYDTELSEYEAIQKGYRVDVFVKVNNQYFNLRVYDIIRLQQEFESEVANRGFYAIEPNLVLVTEVNKAEIVNTIKNLYKQKYFDEIKPSTGVIVEELIEIK